MKTAFRHIKDNYHGNFTVVVIDADGQHTIEDAEKVSAYAERHRSTLVLGSRRQSGKSPLRSRMGNAITRNVFRLTSGLKVYDTQTGLRAFSDSALRAFSVFSLTMEFSAVSSAFSAALLPPRFLPMFSPGS